MKRIFANLYIQFTFFVILLMAPVSLYAYVMGSSSYRINSDSVNIGGNNSQSANYKSEDTAGELATGVSTSTSYGMNAGYQHMQSSFISISSVHNGTMTSVNGVSGGVTNASTTWTVITDNAAGYQLTIKAQTSPALKSAGGASFADYVPTSSDPDFAFTYAPSESRFGFTPEGADVSATYKDNGSICNTGGLNTTDACWDGFTLTNKVIATGATANQPNGATTTIKYRAAIGASKIQDAGDYTSTITVTATTL